MVSVTAQPDIRVVAVKLMTTGLKERQPRQVELGRRPPPAPLKSKSTSAATRPVSLLLSETMKLLMKPCHGAIRPKALQAKAKPTVVVRRRLSPTRRLP